MKTEFRVTNDGCKLYLHSESDLEKQLLELIFKDDTVKMERIKEAVVVTADKKVVK